MHRLETDKDRPHPVDPDAEGFRPDHYAGTVRATGALYPGLLKPRRIADVRAASTAARWVALVVLTAIALLAFVGIAYLWD